MNKKTIIFLIILIILAITILFRWDTNRWEITDRQAVNLQVDRITSLCKYVIYEKGKGENRTIYQNKYLIQGTSAFLYTAIIAVTIALLLEARKKE